MEHAVVAGEVGVAQRSHMRLNEQRHLRVVGYGHARWRNRLGRLRADTPGANGAGQHCAEQEPCGALCGGP